MVRFTCSGCNSSIELPDDRVGSNTNCPDCGRELTVPAAPPSRPAPGRSRRVLYKHHTRDRDGDVIFFFNEPGGDEQALLRSSPVTGLRRMMSAVIDQGGHGGMARYLITTQHTDYEVRMPKDKADHLAAELGITFSD